MNIKFLFLIPYLFIGLSMLVALIYTFIKTMQTDFLGRFTKCYVGGLTIICLIALAGMVVTFPVGLFL